MNKKWILLMLAMVVMLVFAACGTNEQAQQQTPEPPTETPAETPAQTQPAAPTEDGDIITLTVLNYLDFASAGAPDEISDVWDAFEAAHPNIRINRQDEFEDPFHFATEAQAAAGTLPDVIFAWPSGRSTTLHINELLMDLSYLAARDGLANYFIPQALDPSLQVAGFLGMIPQGITASHAFYVNMEVLDAVGLQPARTYSELVEQVPILRAAGFDTILMANQPTWVMQSCLFSMIAGRFMGEDWELRILSGETNFLDPNFIAALDFVRMMYDDGVISRTTLLVDYGEGPGLFATNQAAYFIDGDWRLGDLRTVITPDRQPNFGITVFPEIDLPGVQFNSSSTAVLATGWGLNRNLENDPERMEAAWTLLKWLVSREVQEFRLRVGTFATPSRTDIDLDALAAVMEPMQLTMTRFGDQFDKSTVVIDGVFEGPVFTPLNDGLRAIGMGEQTPQEVAQIVQAAFEAWDATN